MRAGVVGFEEAWFLLQEPAGQRLIEHLNRWGRSEFATPILVTHLLAEAEQIDNLIGARFIFGQESETEAIKGSGCSGSTATTTGSCSGCSPIARASPCSATTRAVSRRSASTPALARGTRHHPGGETGAVAA